MDSRGSGRAELCLVGFGGACNVIRRGLVQLLNLLICSGTTIVRVTELSMPYSLAHIGQLELDGDGCTCG